jgi:hypothetical protein
MTKIAGAFHDYARASKNLNKNQNSVHSKDQMAFIVLLKRSKLFHNKPITADNITSSKSAKVVA